MATADDLAVLRPRWRAPSRVKAATTLRRGGVSTGAFASLNLAGHVGDAPQHVAENRRRLRRALDLPGEPHWIRQVHGTRCIDLAEADGDEQADGSHTSASGRVCAVLTADCLPLFLCDAAGHRVGVFHVGWKGLAAGMVERALSVFADSASVHCWLGPSIGPGAFEIGADVRDALEAPGNQRCFAASVNSGRWMADLYGLVAHRLREAGVDNVGWDETACTFRDADRFFSYRRSSRCGRMASLIWISDPAERAS